jgi:hypothetical protein
MSNELAEMAEAGDTVATVTRNVGVLIVTWDKFVNTCIVKPAVEIHKATLQSNLAHFERAVQTGNRGDAQMILLQCLAESHKTNPILSPQLVELLTRVGRIADLVIQELSQVANVSPAVLNILMDLQQSGVLGNSVTQSSHGGDELQIPAMQEKYANLMNNLPTIAINSLPADTQRFVKTADQGSFASDVHRLYDVQHPLVCLYSTKNDRSWRPCDTHHGLFACLQSTMMAEMHIATATASGIPCFTILHVLQALGCSEEDIPAMAPWLDAAFYRTVKNDSHTWLFAQPFVHRMGVYQGAYERSCLKRWLSKNSRQLESIDDYSTENVWEAPRPVPAHSSVACYTTILGAIAQWMRSDGRLLVFVC